MYSQPIGGVGRTRGKKIHSTNNHKLSTPPRSSEMARQPKLPLLSFYRREDWPLAAPMATGNRGKEDTQRGLIIEATSGVLIHLDGFCGAHSGVALCASCSSPVPVWVFSASVELLRFRTEAKIGACARRGRDDSGGHPSLQRGHSVCL